MKDIILSVFQARAYPHLAATVRMTIPRVVESWVEVIKGRLPGADELTLKELSNSLPKTLERLALALESNSPAATRELMIESEEHGLDRLAHNYSLTELLVEFDLLRPLLIQEVAAQLARDLDLTEFTALNIGIDLVSRRSVIAFVTRQTQLLTHATNMQSRFFAFLSHDIRGGLNAVLMNIDLLKLDLLEDPKFSPALEDLESMRRSILDTVGVMTRYLDAERLRAGTVQPKLSTIDLPLLISDVVGQFRHAALSKGIVLSVDVAEAPAMESDRELITMILQNLVGNAIKYSKKGTVRISADAIGGNGTCHLSVSDEGPGIASEKIGALFEAFKRGETHGQSGLGLGLSIVDHATRLLGAKVKVESDPAVGTTFHIQFPANRS